jgi:hypothetical protein
MHEGLFRSDPVLGIHLQTQLDELLQLFASFLPVLASEGQWPVPVFEVLDCSGLISYCHLVENHPKTPNVYLRSNPGLLIFMIID